MHGLCTVDARAAPVLVATLPSSLSATEYACIDLCAETHPQWPAENVCVWYRRLPGAEMEVCAMQQACPHAGISLMESDIEDFRSLELGSGCRARASRVQRMRSCLTPVQAAA